MLSKTALEVKLTPVCVHFLGFPGDLVVKDQPATAENAGSIPGLGRSSEKENSNPLQCSCLGNPMDKGAWPATVHGVTTESNAT